MELVPDRGAVTGVLMVFWRGVGDDKDRVKMELVADRGAAGHG